MDGRMDAWKHERLDAWTLGCMDAVQWMQGGMRVQGRPRAPRLRVRTCAGPAPPASTACLSAPAAGEGGRRGGLATPTRSTCIHC
eukprot:140489-Chlamydomonas_euryale.AAC.1